MGSTILTRITEMRKDRISAMTAELNVVRYANESYGGLGTNARFVVRIRRVLFIPLLLLSSCARGPDSAPPDLTSCTGLEIRWPRGVAEFFLPDGAIRQGILDPDEKEYIQSLEPYRVTDAQRIRALADVVAQGTYVGRIHGSPSYSTPVHITCYRGNTRLTSFTIYGDVIAVADGGEFQYPPERLDERIVEEPVELRPFEYRYQCARNLEVLKGAAGLFSKRAKEFPAPNKWSDAVLKALKAEKWFICPAVQTGNGKGHSQRTTEVTNVDGARQEARLLESTYAMNPDCGPGSPPDTVLLFETKTGWNQHGGPELFTFDNHDPKGGLVLLKDGTVKFIRTEEELKQLRWK